MPLPHTLKVGDRLIIFGKALEGAASVVGVGTHGRCYPLRLNFDPKDLGTEIILTEASTGALELGVAEGMDPNLQVDVHPLITYKYGWAAKSAGERQLISRNGDQCPISFTATDYVAAHRIADLRVGVYVRFIFQEGAIQVVVVHMTHNGPEEMFGPKISLV